MVDSGHRFPPEEFVHFIELDGFFTEWRDLGLTDDDLAALQEMIMARPKASPVVKGTGGLREARFSPVRLRRGKRGALRVCYAFLEAYKVVILVMVYAKTEKDDLTPRERRTIRETLARIEHQFAKRPIR